MEFMDKTLRPTFLKASDERIAKGLAGSSLRTRRSGWATVLCFVAGVWVDWRFLPTVVIPAAGYVFWNLINGAFQRESDRRQRVGSSYE